MNRYVLGILIQEILLLLFPLCFEALERKKKTTTTKIRLDEILFMVELFVIFEDEGSFETVKERKEEIDGLKHNFFRSFFTYCRNSF